MKKIFLLLIISTSTQAGMFETSKEKEKRKKLEKKYKMECVHTGPAIQRCENHYEVCITYYQDSISCYPKK